MSSQAFKSNLMSTSENIDRFVSGIGVKVYCEMLKAKSIELFSPDSKNKTVTRNKKCETSIQVGSLRWKRAPLEKCETQSCVAQ